MKKIFILLLFVSMSVFADDPDFDTSTGIVTFPRVTVDNSTAFVNVRLLLNPNGTWSILTAEPEATFNLTGNWNGVATSSIFMGCNGQIEGSLTQNGNKLEGTGSLIGNCIGGGSGIVTGEINGNDISFGLAINSNTTISFSGTISSDYRTLNGSYIWLDENDQGTWSLSLQ